MINDGELIYKLTECLNINKYFTHEIYGYKDCIDFEGDHNFAVFKKIMKRNGYWKYLDCKVDNNLKCYNEKQDIYVISFNDEGKKNKNNLITLLKLRGCIL